jgi:SAM-dependent methyltransferase
MGKLIMRHVKNFIINNKDRLKDKIVIDIPAGVGEASETLKSVGARAKPFDLFPEFFKIEGLECKKANLLDRIPVDDSYADTVLCQEGIEHCSDQLKVLREFNRILKQDGTLIITTPNYSNLQSKISYLFSESEYFSKIMPPNEADSIWMADQSASEEVYFGHVFLIGLQKLRFLAKISGFEIEKIHFVKARKTSLLLLPIFYPFILLVSLITYLKKVKNNVGLLKNEKYMIYKEILTLNINPKLLIDHHLFVEFRKEMELNKVAENLNSQLKNFDSPDV